MTGDEELLLDLISNNNFDEYNNCINEAEDKFVIEQLSHIRGNIFNWLELNGQSVLELNGCYGAVSECIAQYVGNIDVVVDKEAQYNICNKRLSRYGNTNVIFQDIEATNSEKKYDYVLVANPYYTSTGHLLRELNNYSNFVKPNGKICVALDNKYGLKYFDGAKEPNIGERFSGIEGYRDYKGVRNFSRQEICDVLKNVGANNIYWYYPYPDRVLPNIVFSDEYLPKKGELINNYRTFGEACVISFDESQAWDNIIGDGLFQQFANSYLLLLEV